MKLLCVYLTSCLLVYLPVQAQTKTDSILTAHSTQLQGLEKKTIEISKSVDGFKVKIDTLNTKLTVNSPKSSSVTCKLGFWEWVLIFSPILFFLLVLLFLKKKLAGFDLKDALTESEPIKKSIRNPEYNIANINALSSNAAVSANLASLLPPTIEVSSDEPPKSSSRYIAFITSSITWGIALCLSCFFIYENLARDKAPVLDGLSGVLLALGIGVVPYAFNKISNAMK